jgi:ABC-type multidrug transport system fused ATPase/permease subunit
LSCFSKFYLKSKGSKNRLTKTLWHLSKPTFIPAGFCQLATVLCQIAMPLLVRELLRVLEDNPGEKVIREGIPFAIGIFFILICNALANHRHRHMATKTGITLRSAIIGVIYDRVLRLSPHGRNGLTTGEVTTMVAIDAQKLFEVTQEAHLIWSMPLSMTLVTICLLVIMGPTTLVGLLVLIMFVPLVERVASRMLAIRHKRVKVTEQRVQIIASMLQGVSALTELAVVPLEVSHLSLTKSCMLTRRLK